MMINEILQGTAINMVWIACIFTALWVIVLAIKTIIKEVFRTKEFELVGTHHLDDVDIDKTIRELIAEDLGKTKE